MFPNGRALASVSSDVCSNDTSRRIAKVSAQPINYDCLVAQLGSVTSECATWSSVAQEHFDDIISLRTLFYTSMDNFKVLEDQIAAMQTKDSSITRDELNAKVGFL